MYCPRCGQQQIADQTKFCSRCGFQLGIVSELLSNGGFLPQLADLAKKKQPKLTRRNGLIFTLFWFLFFLFIMAPFWAIVDVEELAALSGIMAIFGSLILLLMSFLVLKKTTPLPAHMQFDQQQGNDPASLYGNPVQQALPPQQSEPVSSYAPPAAGAWRAPDTGEFAHRPGSVTETTTKLLRREEDEQ